MKAIYHQVDFCTFHFNTHLMPVSPGTEAVLLKDGSIGVSTENKPRAIQSNGKNSRKVTVNRDWLEQLDLADPGEQTVHSLSLGIKPVIVQNPAIIIQPANIIGEVDDD